MTLHSIVIPILNEASEIRICLMQLQRFRETGLEVIVVDGGSVDKTHTLLEGLCDQILSSPRGRATQMNAGAKHAKGEFIFFLHVDTQLPENFLKCIPSTKTKPFCWGRFDVTLSGKHCLFRIIETMMNLRSRWTGIATGDQVMFVSQKLFQKVAGFPEIALMEDIAMSQKLKKICLPLCLKQKVSTSSRRWEKHGIVSTILKMWWLRFSYFIGVNSMNLTKQYDAMPPKTESTKPDFSTFI